MKRQRHKARIVALQGLYQLDIQRASDDVDIEGTIAPLLAEADLSKEVADYVRCLTAGVWAQHDRYDQMIAGASEHWEVSRMAVVDRNILRMALYELLEQLNVPARVVIDEAIEIGREFGSAETPQFVNGVLDALWKHHPDCKAARPEDGRSPAVHAANNEEKDGTV